MIFIVSSITKFMSIAARNVQSVSFPLIPFLLFLISLFKKQYKRGNREMCLYLLALSHDSCKFVLAVVRMSISVFYSRICM